LTEEVIKRKLRQIGSHWTENEQKMKNVEMKVKVKDNILNIKVDLTKEFCPSASGQNIIVASTHQSASIPDKKDIHINLNVCKNKKASSQLNDSEEVVNDIIQSVNKGQCFYSREGRNQDRVECLQV